MYGIINFQTTLGAILMIRRVEVMPKQSAEIKCIYSDNGNEKHTIVLSGADYANWGDNDDYLGFICLQKINPLDKIVNYTLPQSTYGIFHNEADIALIQTLQEQLDLQTSIITNLLTGATGAQGGTDTTGTQGGTDTTGTQGVTDATGTQATGTQGVTDATGTQGGTDVTDATGTQGGTDATGAL
jgi:hypothetical protein